MAVINFYNAIGLTNGSSGYLDSIDGADLGDGDVCFVIIATEEFYLYRLNATSGAVESSPDIISPDDNAGDKRWILIFDSVTGIAHKDTHDPNDGSDPLDTAAAAEISGVVAAGTGTSHSLSRADHIHAINHGITDNHIVTVDDADAADDDYAKFTANGLEGRSASEAFGDIKQAATEEATGVVEFATDAETLTGTATDKVVTPANVTAKLASPSAIGGTTPAAGNFTDLTLTQTLKQFQGADVASANDMTLGVGNLFDITGVTTINTIATKGVGTVIVLQFDGILQLTHSADLFLPTAGNITTAAGDIAVLYEYASGDWRCVAYQRVDGKPLVGLQAGDAIDMADALLTRPEIKDYSETPQAPSSTSTTVLNVEDGNVISFTLTEATTVSTSNTLADKAGSLSMFITAAAGSEYAITWPATWKWAGGAAPATFAVSTEHQISLQWLDGDDTAKFYATYINSYATV